MTHRPDKNSAGVIRMFKTGRRLFIATLPVCALLTALCSLPVSAQNQSLPATAPRSRQLIDLTRVNETWARDWDITHTAVIFPDGGQAGFYRRPPRVDNVVPHTGRLGILYLYPESDYNPARISRRYVEIARDTSRLVIGACANRTPRGEWLLRILVNDQQIGDEIVISGQDGWRDIACDLSAFLGQRVDIEIQAHVSTRRTSHVYIDYIHLEDPARQPVSSLQGPGPDGRNDFNAFSRKATYDSESFDIYYNNFLELLLDREDRRRYDQNYILNRHNPHSCPRRP